MFVIQRSNEVVETKNYDQNKRELVSESQMTSLESGVTCDTNKEEYAKHIVSSSIYSPETVKMKIICR